MFTGKGLPTAVRTQFNYHLENFNKARNEEQRVEAMTAAHQYFMQLTASCDSEEDLNKLGASYQVFYVKFCCFDRTIVRGCNVLRESKVP